MSHRGSQDPMFDGSHSKVVWGTDLQFGFDPHDLLQQLAHGVDNQMQHKYDGVVPDVPCVFDKVCGEVIWDREISDELVDEKSVPEVIWDEEQQLFHEEWVQKVESHDSILMPVAQGECLSVRDDKQVAELVSFETSTVRNEEEGELTEERSLTNVIWDREVALETNILELNVLEEHAAKYGEPRKLSVAPKTNDLLLDHVNDPCVLLEFALDLIQQEGGSISLLTVNKWSGSFSDESIKLHTPRAKLGKAERVPTRKHGEISLSDKQFLYAAQMDTRLAGMILEEDNAEAHAQLAMFRKLRERKHDTRELFCKMDSEIEWDDSPSNTEIHGDLLQLVMGAGNLKNRKTKLCVQLVDEVLTIVDRSICLQVKVRLQWDPGISTATA